MLVLDCGEFELVSFDLDGALHVRHDAAFSEEFAFDEEADVLAHDCLSYEEPGLGLDVEDFVSSAALLLLLLLLGVG